MREVLVRCGGAQARRPSGVQVLELDVAAPKSSAAKVNLALEHITSPMVQDVPRRADGSP
jgi:hypothetical protein